MKDRERMEQIDTLMSGLKTGIGKSNFVGTMIQLIGICKINNFEKEEIFQLFQTVLFEAEFDENQNHDYLILFFTLPIIAHPIAFKRKAPVPQRILMPKRQLYSRCSKELNMHYLLLTLFINISISPKQYKNP